jgi:hypothetical protein
MCLSRESIFFSGKLSHNLAVSHVGSRYRAVSPTGPFQRAAQQDNSFLQSRQFLCVKKNVLENYCKLRRRLFRGRVRHPVGSRVLAGNIFGLTCGRHDVVEA